MPREIVFKINKKEFRVSPLKIDRHKLYGWIELMAVDENEDLCQLLMTDKSGKYVIPLGGTGIGVLSESGKWVERSELETIDNKGKPANLFESSFNKVNELKHTVTSEEFLDYNITDFYQLTNVTKEMIKAVGDKIYRFEYTYNDSYDPSWAFVMAAENKLFLLVAIKNIFEFLCFGDCETIDEDRDDRLIDDEEDDIDFTMF